jgi:hypothetical protein
MCRELTVVCSEIHTKHVTALGGLEKLSKTTRKNDKKKKLKLTFLIYFI